MERKSWMHWLNSSSGNRKFKTCPELSRRIQNRKWVGRCAFLLALSVCGAKGEAQGPKKIPRVGVLVTGSGSYVGRDAFPQTLRELGYIEGHNIVIEYRSAEGKNARQPELARELVNMNVDVLVSGGGNDVTRALMQATKTIPIVMTAGSDAVARGLISSLARPGGNVTGLTSLWDDLTGKRLELLKDAIPKLTRVAVLWHSSGGRRTQWKASQAAARQLNLQLHSMEIHSAEDFENVFKEAAKARSGAVAVTQSSEVGSNPQRVINLASKHRLPAIYAIPEYAESGGLMAYGTNRADLYRRAAFYVDKILKGANPAELPVEQPTKFELVINLQAAKQIDLMLPHAVLARADKVIK